MINDRLLGPEILICGSATWHGSTQVHETDLVVLVSCVLVIALVAAGVLFITSRHSDPLSASEATEALRNVAVSGIGPVDEVEGPIRYTDVEPLQFKSTQC